MVLRCVQPPADSAVRGGHGWSPGRRSLRVPRPRRRRSLPDLVVVELDGRRAPRVSRPERSGFAAVSTTIVVVRTQGGRPPRPHRAMFAGVRRGVGSVFQQRIRRSSGSLLPDRSRNGSVGTRGAPSTRRRRGDRLGSRCARIRSGRTARLGANRVPTRSRLGLRCLVAAAPTPTAAGHPAALRVPHLVRGRSHRSCSRNRWQPGLP